MPMRVRTDAKRQEIVEVASELFLAHGYERTSMAMVSQRLGGSKATLYGYFKSKEELLLAVLEADVEEITEEVIDAKPGEDLREWLMIIGERMLTARTSGRPPKFFRIMSSMPADSEVGRTFYKDGIVPAYRRLCDIIEDLVKKGMLRDADPWTMAMHLKGLLDRDLFERAVLSPRETISAREIEQAAAEAADVFLRAYGAAGAFGSSFQRLAES
jgi:AcrR family transcriptional regulator